MASFVRLAVVVGSAVLGLPMFGGCASADAPNQAGGVAERETTPEPTHDARVVWAEVLDVKPDAVVVTDASWRSRIEATGYPWRVRHQPSGIEMLLVPPGEYTRGASPGDVQARDVEKPAHSVSLTKAFYLGRYEVTQSEWSRVVGRNPSSNQAGDRFPVENVSWDDIRGSGGFTERAGGDLRLPTEGEWEYACRTGSTDALYGALDDIAWFSDSQGLSAHMVGDKRANALGLSDMLGNVFEWCEDWYSDQEYSRCLSGVTDPQGPASGDLRVARGCCWRCYYWLCRASTRSCFEPGYGDDHLGFRVARTP